MSGGYQAYGEYKESGVEWLGSVPVNWQIIAIKYISQLIPRKSAIPRSKLSEACSFIPMEKLKFNTLVLDEERVINKVYDGYTYFEDGDILIAKVTPCFENKNMVVAEGLKNRIGFGSSEIYVLRCGDQTHRKFLFYRLQEDSFMAIAIAAMSGAGGLKRVPADTVNSYLLGLPEWLEQVKIAAFLDHQTAKIDTLIEKQNQLIELLKEKRQAVISHAVTKGLDPDVPMKDSGVEWLGEVPEHWVVCAIKHIVSIPITDGPHETPNFIDEGVPFISAEAISSGKINFSKKRAHISLLDHKRFSQKYSPKYNDIYMVKSGATTGVTAIVETRRVFNIWSPLAVIRCNAYSEPYFVLSFLRSMEFQKAVELNWSFGTQQNIGMGVIGNIYIVRPPIKEATEIYNYLKSKLMRFDELIYIANNQILLMQERRTALISAAVTGKIDVRHWHAPQVVTKSKIPEATA